MKNLVLKDIRLLGVFNILIGAMPVILGFISIRPGKNYEAILIYFFAVLVPVYLLVVRMSVNDMQSNANPLLISLPVKRFDIVKARYISVFIYVVLISMLVYLSSNISRYFLTSKNTTKFTISTMYFTAALIILFLSVNIPFQYFNIRNAQIFNAVFYMVLILVPSQLARFNVSVANNTLFQKLLSLDIKVLGPVLLLVSLVVYGGSSFVSKSIYEGKEF